MAQAFRDLDFVVYDYEDMFLYTIPQWTKFEEATSTQEKHKILYAMLKDVDVVMDIPFYTYWKEIMEVFPDCKGRFQKPFSPVFISR